MRRSTTLDPQRFAGVYELSYGGGGEPSGTAPLEIGPDGVALLGEHRVHAGDTTGTMTTAECRIAPAGNLTCSAWYLQDEYLSVNPAQWTGVLSIGDDGVATASGYFLIGVEPPIDLYIHGDWSAVRR